MTQFWIHNPITLFDNTNIMQLWPQPTNSFEENLNIMTRLIILLTLIGYIIHNKSRIILIGFLSIFLILTIFYVRKYRRENFTNDAVEIKEEFEEIKSNNPLGNVLINDIHTKPDRKEAPPAYCKSTETEINGKTKEMIKQINPGYTDIDKKLFQDLGDEFQFDNSMRQFYSMPNTQVPNNQTEFAKFCYGNLPSRKEENLMQY